MSWAKRLTLVSLDDLENAQLDKNDAYGDHSLEVEQQFVKAKAMAKQLIQSGVVGEPSKKFHVNLSGHANPNHEPASGFVNDCIGINVAQATH